jgi:heptosyltransferase-2
MKSLKRILVRSPNWIGDQILAYPFFYYLRAAYPSAHITAVCVSWVEAVQFRDCVDEVYVLPKLADRALKTKFNALETAASELKAKGEWDLGISLPNSFSAAWLLFRAGAKIRRGYSLDGRGLLLTDRVHWNKKSTCHRSQAYIELLPGYPDISFNSKKIKKIIPAQEFWGILPEDDLDPGVPGVIDSFDASKAWPNSDPIEAPQRPYWVLAPGSTAESRRWSEERFRTLAEQVAKERGWTGIIVGGPAESEVAERLAEDSSLKLEDWTARGSVTSDWKVFKNAKFSICNDSGLAHVASLCGSPVQVVWGAGNPNRTEPIGPGKVQVVMNPIDCWPCEQNFCSLPEGRKFECLRGIEATRVWEEIKSGIKV